MLWLIEAKNKYLFLLQMRVGLALGEPKFTENENGQLTMSSPLSRYRKPFISQREQKLL